MRRLLIPFTLAVALFCASPLLKSSEHKTIAGNWVLDTSSAPQINGRQVTAGILTINYTHKNIEMSETLTFPDGDHSMDRNWKIDNHFHPVLGAGEGQTSAKWDRMTLTADHEENGAHEMTRLSLSPDRQILTQTTRRLDGSTLILVWKRAG